jgi:hypothetical protein
MPFFGTWDNVALREREVEHDEEDRSEEDEAGPRRPEADTTVARRLREEVAERFPILPNTKLKKILVIQPRALWAHMQV